MVVDKFSVNSKNKLKKKRRIVEAAISFIGKRSPRRPERGSGRVAHLDVFCLDTQELTMGVVD
jgi:hypothetical protein